MAAAKTGFDREAASNSVSVVAFTSPALAYPSAKLADLAPPSSTAQLAPGTEASAIHSRSCTAGCFRLSASVGMAVAQAAPAVPTRIVLRVGFIREFAGTS